MTSILIVDDEALIRRGLESLIPWERLNCSLADQASNGAEGLEKIRRYHPDIVFTDIKMPQMDGLQMIEKLFWNRILLFSLSSVPIMILNWSALPCA